MKQRRTVALFFVCTVLALPVSAFDWGGLVSNETALRGRWNTGIQNTVQQTNKLTLWMRTPLPRFKNSYFTAETFYLGAYSGFDKEFSHIWDINLLKANLAFEKKAPSCLRQISPRLLNLETKSLVIVFYQYSAIMYRKINIFNIFFYLTRSVVL